MHFGIGKSEGHTAAWRISFWSTLAFAVGSVILFLFLQRFASHEIQRRTDAWLSGEVETLGDVAERTPKNALYERIVDEVAELATKEVPLELQGGGDPNQSVFFLETDSDNRLKLWAPPGKDSSLFLAAIAHTSITPGTPVDISVPGYFHRFRVACLELPGGDRIFLGLSEAHDVHVLNRMRIRLFAICLAVVVLGFLVVFFATKRMLDRVHRITRTANRIGQYDLRSRVPEVKGTDEIAQLARTLNNMLDRIENSVNQLHTITNSLAHDLRSPLMAIRGKLELALLADHESSLTDPVASALEEVDRLSDFLTKSLDVAEANADALHLRRVPVDLDELLRSMVDLYEPSLTERGLEGHGPQFVGPDGLGRCGSAAQDARQSARQCHQAPDARDYHQHSTGSRGGIRTAGDRRRWPRISARGRRSSLREVCQGKGIVRQRVGPGVCRGRGARPWRADPRLQRPARRSLHHHRPAPHASRDLDVEATFDQTQTSDLRGLIPAQLSPFQVDFLPVSAYHHRYASLLLLSPAVARIARRGDLSLHFHFKFQGFRTPAIQPLLSRAFCF